MATGVQVTGTITPLNGATSFPTTTPQTQLGGFRVVADTTARDAIPAAYRESGMLVYTAADGKYWQLGNDLVTWTQTLKGAVSSVFGRIGAVVAAFGDYAASLIQNDSGVSGTTVANALNNLQAAIFGVSGIFSTVWNKTIKPQEVYYSTNANTVITPVTAGPGNTFVGRFYFDASNNTATRTVQFGTTGGEVIGMVVNVIMRKSTGGFAYNFIDNLSAQLPNGVTIPASGKGIYFDIRWDGTEWTVDGSAFQYWDF